MTMRSLFGERVLTTAILKSTATDAGLTKQTLWPKSGERTLFEHHDRARERSMA